MIKYFGGQHSIYVSPKTLATYYTDAKPNCAPNPNLNPIPNPVPSPNPALATYYTDAKPNCAPTPNPNPNPNANPNPNPNPILTLTLTPALTPTLALPQGSSTDRSCIGRRTTAGTSVRSRSEACTYPLHPIVHTCIQPSAAQRAVVGS